MINLGLLSMARDLSNGVKLSLILLAIPTLGLSLLYWALVSLKRKRSLPKLKTKRSSRSKHQDKITSFIKDSNGRTYLAMTLFNKTKSHGQYLVPTWCSKPQEFVITQEQKSKCIQDFRDFILSYKPEISSNLVNIKHKTQLSLNHKIYALALSNSELSLHLMACGERYGMHPSEQYLLCYYYYLTLLRVG